MGSALPTLFDLSWWRRRLEPLPEGYGNETSKGNRTGDVFCANCISDPDPIACGRAVAVAFLAVITAGIAIGRVLSLHARRRLSPGKLALYYLLVVHLCAGSLEWVFGWSTAISLFISYTKAVELLIICYFYVDMAAKMMQWNSMSGRSLALCSLFLMFVFFTLFGVLGFMLSIEAWTDCHAAYWIWFSLGQLVTVQLMVISFLLILHSIHRIADAPAIRATQKTRLLCLLYVFEISAFADVAYHVSMFVLADDQKGCSGIFQHNQWYYSLVKFPYDVVSFLLPVWAILYVIRPTRKMPVHHVDERGMDDEESSSETDIVVVRNYNRRYRPLNIRYEGGNRSRSDDRQQLMDARQRVRRQTGRTGVRRVNSAPSMVPPPSRASVSRSLISSPLYPIPEEPLAFAHSHQDHYLDGVEGGVDNEAMQRSIDNVSLQGLVEGER